MVTDTTLEGPNGPRIIYVNRAWLKMTGYGREEIGLARPRACYRASTRTSAVVGSLEAEAAQP